MKTTWIFVAGLLVVLASSASAQKYENKEYGFSLIPPEAWQRVPVKAEEKWIVARFQCNKGFSSKEAYDQHIPVMKVILFPKKKVETGESKAEVDLEDILTLLSNPYKDYKDYLARTFDKGGFYVSLEKEDKVGGIAVTRLEVKVEKLAAYGEMTIITWVYKGPIGDFAVETEVLQGAYEKLSPLVYGSLKTFRIIPREVEEKGSLTKDKKEWVDEDKLTPEQRKAHRKELADEACKKARKDLPSGWGALETEHFTVVYHTTGDKAAQFANQAEAVRYWLDANFGKFSTEYVGKCVLRICADETEEGTYHDTSGGGGFNIGGLRISFTSFDDREIVVNAGSSQGRKWEYAAINERVFDKYMNDKGVPMGWESPDWLDEGFTELLDSAFALGKNLQFKVDEYETENFREAKREGKFLPIKDLMTLTSKERQEQQVDWSAFTAQCGSVVRYLMGPGNAGPTKQIIFKYLENLRKIEDERRAAEKKKREEEEAARKAKGGDEETKKGPKSEEEEEEEFKKRRQKQPSNEDWEKGKKEIALKLLEMTFAGWSDAQWAALDRAWKASAK